MHYQELCKPKRIKAFTGMLILTCLFMLFTNIISYADGTGSDHADRQEESITVCNTENTAVLIEFEHLNEYIRTGNPTYLKVKRNATEALSDMDASFAEFRMSMQDSIDEIDTALDGLYDMQKMIKGSDVNEFVIGGMTLSKEAALSFLAESIKQSKTGRKQIRSSVSSVRKGITDGYKKVDKAMLAVEKPLTGVMEGLFISYKQIGASKKMLLKQEELLSETLSMYQSMEKKGMAVGSDIASYENQLAVCRQSIEALDSAAASLKGSLGLQLGFTDPSAFELADLADPDMEFLEKRNVDEDRKRTAEGNSTVRNAGKVKTYSSYGRTLRDMTENEALGKAYSAFDNLTADLRSAKAKYEAAENTKKIAADTESMAERQYRLGITSKVQYEGQKMACVSYEASAEMARLNYIQAVRNYYWAVNGNFSF